MKLTESEKLELQQAFIEALQEAKDQEEQMVERDAGQGVQ